MQKREDHIIRLIRMLRDLEDEEERAKEKSEEYVKLPSLRFGRK